MRTSLMWLNIMIMWFYWPVIKAKLKSQSARWQYHIGNRSILNYISTARYHDVWRRAVCWGRFENLPARLRWGWTRPRALVPRCPQAVPALPPAAPEPASAPSASLRGHKETQERSMSSRRGKENIWSSKPSCTRGLSPVLRRGSVCSRVSTANPARFHCRTRSSSVSSPSGSAGSSRPGCSGGDRGAGPRGAPLCELEPLHTQSKRILNHPRHGLC